MSDATAIAGTVSLLPPAASGVLAFQLGVGDNWPILVVGVGLGLFAKAAVTISSGRKYERQYLYNDLLMAGFLVVVAGFVTERWIASPVIPVTTYGMLLLSAGLAIAGDRVRATAAWAASAGFARSVGVAIPPADAVAPFPSDRPIDPRASPVAQLGARRGAEEVARGEPDQDVLDKLKGMK